MFKKIKSIRFYAAFTLCEILIVVGIIGVVAELTIPTLIADTQTQVTVSMLKKSYSTLSQAYTMAVQENGTPDNWGIVSGVSPPVLSMLKPYLKVDKDCTDGGQGCFPPITYYYFLTPSLGSLGMLDNQTYPKIKLMDGTLIIGFGQSPNCIMVRGNSLALQNICGEFSIDINGYKKPNQLGKDMFNFYLTKYGIIPEGTAQDTVINFSNVFGCQDKDNSYGYGCAAWVIYNGNMDYLKCNNLSWNGPTKCQ